ncbi:PAS domain S-box protein [Nocardia sp. NPDC004123]
MGPTELFFSTTDRHGVIRLGNSVFARVSGYAPDELAGAPHNIVRHPDMPAGVFELAWERLLSGRPVGAFVQNQDRDGSRYWVFATMSSLCDGYLSVRIASRSGFSELIEPVYAHARAIEDRARQTGAGRLGRAVSGAQWSKKPCVIGVSRPMTSSWQGFDRYFRAGLFDEQCVPGIRSESTDWMCTRLMGISMFSAVHRCVVSIRRGTAVEWVR